MMRIAVRAVIGCLVAALVWWVGPLLSIGVYRPLGWLLLRQILVTLILLWAFWPVLVRLWVRLSMSVRRMPAPVAAKRVETQDAIALRVRDLDQQLQRQWLRGRPGWRAKWLMSRTGAHRTTHPWFFVLGPSGSGKTTLLRRGNAALKGRGEDAVGEYASDTGHTVDCTFWQLGGALWIDVNGEWLEPGGALSTDAGPGWRHLVKALARLQRQPALDGIGLCMDCAWLLGASAEQRKRLAESLRARLADLSEAFGIRLPVHLLMTGMDKLQGALPFLGKLDDAALERGIGFNLPMMGGGEGIAAAGAEVEQAMLALESRIQQHVQFMAPQGGSPEHTMARIELAEALSLLRGRIVDVLDRCLVGPAASEMCQLRGIWFGTSVDLTDDLRPAFWDESIPPDSGIRRLAGLWCAPLQQLRTEQGLSAGVKPRSTKARVWRGVRWAGCGLAVAGAFAVIGWGYIQERNYLAQVWARFSEGKRLAEQQSASALPSSALIEVLSQMRYAKYNIQDGNGWMMLPYIEHTRVASVSRETYQRHLRKTLMPELYNHVRQTLDAQLKDGTGDIYETLKVYLMLARPARRNPEDLVRWMQPQWVRLVGSGYSEAEQAEYEGHLRALFSASGVPGTPEDAEVVREARVQADQVPSVVRVIKKIQDQGLPEKIEAVSLVRAGGFIAATTLRMRGDLAQTDAAIPGWYTRAGYNDVFKPRLNAAAQSSLEEESWVLRDQPLNGNTFEIEKATQRLSDAARSQFLQDYIRRWQAFLNDVTIRGYSGLDDAAQIASTFIDPQSPLAQLIRFAGRETSLLGNYEGDLDSWIDKQKYNLEKGRRAIVGEISGEHTRTALLPEHVVEDHFEAIRRLAVQLTQSATASGGSNPLSRLFEPLYRQLGLVNGAMMAGQILPEYDAFARMRGEAARQPEPIRGIMLDLVDGGRNMSARQSGAMLSKAAASATRSFCDQGLTSKYPFKRSVRSEVGILNFESLFGPQGTLAQQFKEQLAAYVDTSTSPWRARRIDGGGSLVNADVLRAYEAADRIRTSMLDEQGHLRISVMLRIVDMDPQIAEAQLDLGGTSFRYTHGSVPTRRVDWNGNGGNGGQVVVRLFLRTVDGRTTTMQFDGPWALFQFFDAGRQSGGSPERRETTHDTALGAVHIEWQALTTPMPLWSNLLEAFRCPR